MSQSSEKTSPQLHADQAISAPQFEALDLTHLGLVAEDYLQVVEASKELAHMTTMTVAEYGKNIASKTSAYTDDILTLVQNKELDETGQKLTQVINVAQQINSQNLLAENRNTGFFGALLSKFKQAKQSYEARFNDSKAQIDTLVHEIEHSQAGLKQRVQLLDSMFQALEEQYHSLGIYVAAGQLKRQQLAQQIVALSPQQHDQSMVQKVYDLNHISNNLEKRIHDLQILQQSALQTLPMIRIIQSNNLMLVDKFYAIKNITLPAWKNQMSLALALNEQKNSVELAKSIDDATNQILRKNAELLQRNSVNTAKANQRSVIDIETLELVQNSLITTVNDVLQIQKEGMAQRAQTTEKLKSLQSNLTRLVLNSSQISLQPQARDA